MNISSTGNEVTNIIKKLMLLEWIPKSDIYEINSKSINAYCTPFLELIEYFESLKNKTILITDMAVFPEIPYYSHDGSHCISIADMANLINGCILVSKLSLKTNWQCSEEQCVFNLSAQSYKHICKACEDRLEKTKGGIATAARLIALTEVADYNIILDIPLKSYLKQINAKSNNPIIDHYILSCRIDASLKGPILNNIRDAACEVMAEKRKIDEHYKGKIGFIAESEIIINRRWNSWTPSLPTVDESKKQVSSKIGGGYFITDGKTRIVIDPGYGYLQSLFIYHDITVADIDVVIVTHDHPDHNAELINLFGLRVKYNNPDKKKLKLFLNGSSHYLYYPYVSYHDKIIDENSILKPLLPGDSISLENINIKTIGMNHDEMFSKLKSPPKKNNIVSASLGLVVEMLIEGKEWKIGIPGDTSFTDNEAIMNRWFGFYKNCDVLSLHLGSIEEEWHKHKNKKPSLIRYGENKHLGIIGVIYFIGLIKPTLTVITEFGVELAALDYRITIVDMIKAAIGDDTVILPSDVELALKIKNNEIMCRCKCKNGYVPINKIQTSIHDEMISYKYPAGCQSKMHHYR